MANTVYNQSMILGIDEVGRGPWAGPLVVGAVVLGETKIEGLADSKKLTAKKRAALDVEIREHAAAIGLGWVYADELDEIGLSEALCRATVRAVEQIDASYHQIIIDGTVNFLRNTNKGNYVTLLKKADQLIASVSAASIIAKVARDGYMALRAIDYPNYGFDSHVGYGTVKHRQAIDKYGVCDEHRLSFAPLVKYRTDSKADDTNMTVAKSSKQIGDEAEVAATRYLLANGHEILHRNWKTRYCEIDIISLFDNTIYFTEVKYRKSSVYGGGVGAITAKKLRQMQFAIKIYTSSEKLQNKNLRLAVVSVSGTPPTIETFLELE